MISNIYCIFFITLIFVTITHGRPRYRRQLNQPVNNALPYDPRTSWASNPSGSIKGTYYYGIGADPNYGSFIKPINRPSSGFLPISYNPDSSWSNYLINPNHQGSLQPPRESNMHMHHGNTWQGPNMNNNNYYNRQPNYYRPGYQGWYSGGSHHWYNKAQCFTVHQYLLILSMLVLMICK